jgi:cysteine-rich CPXCG protein
VSFVHFARKVVFMNLEEEIEVTCPYCGAAFTTFADTSEGSFSTIEDCEVCCRPIEISVACHAGEVEGVEVARS